MGIAERREREREELRTRIVEAARDILSAEGLDALSIRSIAEKGIWLTSTAEPESPWAATRRPLSSTRVAALPWPRRLADERPLVPRWAPLTTSEFEARLSGVEPLVEREPAVLDLISLRHPEPWRPPAGLRRVPLRIGFGEFTR